MFTNQVCLPEDLRRFKTTSTLSSQATGCQLQPPSHTLTFFLIQLLCTHTDFGLFHFCTLCFHNFSVWPCHQPCLQSHLAFIYLMIYFEQNPMASLTKPFHSIATSNVCFTNTFFTISFKYQFSKFKSTNQISLLSFSSSSKLPSSNISLPSSDQGTTLKLSAPLQSLKLLVVLSCLTVGLICI